MCYDNCSVFFNIEETKISADTSDVFFKMQSNYSFFESSEGLYIEKGMAKKIYKLIQLLPENIEQYNSKIGCPDCLDQCGILIKTKASQHFIDPNNHPQELEKFCDELLTISNDFRNKHILKHH